MVRGIDSCELFVTFVTTNYMKKVNQSDLRDRCKIEFKYAFRRFSPDRMIPVVMEGAMLDQRGWGGTLGACIGGCLFIDLASDDPALFARSLDSLEAHAKRLLLPLMVSHPDPFRALGVPLLAAPPTLPAGGGSQASKGGELLPRPADRTLRWLLLLGALVTVVAAVWLAGLPVSLGRQQPQW